MSKATEILNLLEKQNAEREARNIIDAEAESLVGLTKAEVVSYLMDLVDGLDEKTAQSIFHSIAGKTAKKFSF